MARIPLTEKNVLHILKTLSGGWGTKAVFYPFTLQITFQGKPREIRVICEQLAARGIVERHTSKIPLVYTVFGYGYYLPKD